MCHSRESEILDRTKRKRAERVKGDLRESQGRQQSKRDDRIATSRDREKNFDSRDKQKSQFDLEPLSDKNCLGFINDCH